MKAAEAARIHAAAFPPAERWGEDAIALLLGLPGSYAHHIPDIGFVLARVAADEAEILTLAVVPEARGQGHGAVLLMTAMAGAVARGARSMFLEVSMANVPARKLYAGGGFAEVGRRPRYYADGSDALVLRRDFNLE